MILENVVLNLTSVSQGEFPKPSKGYALIDSYSEDKITSDGYKLAKINNSVGLSLDDNYYKISKVCFNGYVNTNDPTCQFGILFSSDGETWTDVFGMDNDGSKLDKKYTVPESIIPDDAIFVKVSRISNKTTYISQIEVETDPVLYEYEGFEYININGELIDGFSPLKTDYAIALPVVGNLLSVDCEPKDSENVTKTVTIKKTTDNLWVATISLSLPDSRIIKTNISVVDTRFPREIVDSDSKISINQFRVSADNQYLDMIFSCPKDYYFKYFYLEVRTPVNGKMISQSFDLAPALFSVDIENNTIDNKRFVLRLPFTKLGINPNSIFIGTLKADYLYIYREGFGIKVPYIDQKYIPKKYNDSLDYYIFDSENQEFVLDKSGHLIKCLIFGQCDNIKDEISDTMICSNVNGLYRCMRDEILNQDPCSLVSDDLIRKYFLLYGHEAALKIRDLDVAEVFYRLMQNCFNSCPLQNVKMSNSCNCGR